MAALLAAISEAIFALGLSAADVAAIEHEKPAERSSVALPTPRETRRLAEPEPEPEQALDLIELDDIEELEVLLRICSFLAPRELARMACVS
eukprot:COSAG04_NODE_22527_length_353_cov_1.023622_1_plen_91_part_01